MKKEGKGIALAAKRQGTGLAFAHRQPGHTCARRRVRPYRSPRSGPPLTWREIEASPLSEERLRVMGQHHSHHLAPEEVERLRAKYGDKVDAVLSEVRVCVCACICKGMRLD
jgi:hypothetical protein